jgi:hypothetical protein
MSRRFPWSRLGIDETRDAGAIRKAYADALRAINVDEDIPGYTELRRARDQALWLAAQPEPGEVEDDADDGSLYGLGDFDDDYDDDEWDDGGQIWDVAPGLQQPLPGPADDPADAPPREPELTEAQRRAQAAWKQLLAVLYPDDMVSDEAVTHEELAEGLAALDVLIARANEADLLEHDALDDGLAELFARTWPRSAPFVEPANAAFGWLDEAGALEERGALMFLNQRLKGMRFHEKVQQPQHPLHKAWVELSRPGRVTLLDRLRVKRLEIDKLLDGIRQRYPELESHLDPERVASWDKGGALDGQPGGLGPQIVRWGFIVLVVGILALRLIAGFAGSDSDPSQPDAEAVAERLRDAEVEMALADIFGPEPDTAAVRATDPAFAQQFEAIAERRDKPRPAMLAYVRLKAAASTEGADRNSLAVRADLRHLWMTAARRQSDAVCRKVMSGDFADLDLGLTDKERDRERTLLKQLLDAKLLGKEVKGGAYRYSIPGWLVGDTIKRSKLSPDALTAALTDPDNPNRCRAEAALLEAVRAAPGKAPLEVMKGI